MLKRVALLIAVTLSAFSAFAQHEHHEMTIDDLRRLVAAGSQHGPVIPQPSFVVTPTATRTITLTASSFQFSPSTITVNQGDIVQLTFTVPNGDASSVGHGLLMETYFDGFSNGSQQPFNVGRGKSVTKTFTATTSGTFQFACNISTCGNGHSNMLGTFTVTPQANPAPTINGLNPSSGPSTGGQTTTITGTNFASGATVTFGGTAATNVNVVSSTSITAVTPAHAVGSVAVTVANSDGQSATSSNGYQYNLPGPTLTGISPASGPPAGGQSVTITGTNFVSGDSVTFGGTAATNVNVVSATSITAVTPGHAIGKVNVTVASPDGLSSATLNSGYEYLVSVLTLTGINPATGPTSGNTLITLTGTNFQAGATVTMGGLPATDVTVVNATTITARTPLGPATQQVSQPVVVKVTNPDSLSVSASIFTYSVPPLAIADVIQPTGPPAGGNVVIILGAGFTTGVTSSLTFGGVAATNLQVVNAVTLSASAPPHAAGFVDVVVTMGSASAKVTNGYVYGNPTSKKRIAKR